MEKEDLYPGRILKNLKFVDESYDGGYNLSYKDTSGKVVKFYLSRDYFNSDLNIADVLNGDTDFFVLGDAKDKNGNDYDIAVNNYHQSLFNEIYKNGWDTPVSDTSIPWKDLWMSAFNKNFQSVAEIIEPIKENTQWGVKTPYAYVPIYTSRFVKHMQGTNFFYPYNLSSDRKKRLYEYSAYRLASDNTIWPRVYNCDFVFHIPRNEKEINRLPEEINQLPFQKRCTVFLHGFLDPLKLHYKIWKHLTDDTRVSEKYTNPCTLALWNSFSGMDVPSGLGSTIFKKCVPPKTMAGKDPTRCYECNRNQFKEVNKKIERYYNAYLEKAAMFFEKCPTNYTDIYLLPSNVHQFLDFILYDNNISSGGNKSDTNAMLVLKGNCYNLNQDNNKPVVHLFFISFYTSSDKIYPNPKVRELNKVGYAQLINIKKVTSDGKLD